jgi:hypothetical protein
VDSLDELQLQTLDECSNDDSSYDSDFGGDDDASGNQHFSGHHDDISRTTSDTLGAEYADYVSAAAYKSRVDFALKLGYTERLVQTAISKLGPEPTQDQLLAVSLQKIYVIITSVIISAGVTVNQSSLYCLVARAGCCYFSFYCVSILNPSDSYLQLSI